MTLALLSLMPYLKQLNNEDFSSLKYLLNIITKMNVQNMNCDKTIKIAIITRIKSIDLLSVFKFLL